MRKLRTEKGAIMVEATIYLPLVLCTVMALVYLALFNMQEYMMMYEVQKIAAVAAREEAYIGYEGFGMGSDGEIDFDWGEGNVPSEEAVTAYYRAHHARATDMYRELTGWFTDNRGEYESRFADAARDASLLALGTVNQPEVSIQKNLLGTRITVEITHSLPVPGVMRYLEMGDRMEIRSVAYSYSVNPGSFVRNVDLAADLTAYIFEKLGLGDRYQGFLEKTDSVLGLLFGREE